MAQRGIPRIFWFIAVIIFVLFILGTTSDILVNWIWLKGVGYEDVFIQIKGTQLLLFAGALIVALVYILLNVRYLTKKLSPIRLNLGQTPMGEVNIRHVRPAQVKRVAYTVGIFFSLFFALSFLYQWDTYFRFQWSQPFGIEDPVFCKDVSFYTFQLPFIELVQNSLSFLVFFVTLFVILYYTISGMLTFQRGQLVGKLKMSERAQNQVFFNLGIWLLLLACGYFLQRYQILFSRGELVYGGGYTEIHIVLPVLWGITIGVLLLAVLVFFQIYRRSLKFVLTGGISLFILAVLARLFLPGAIQNFIVEPNELNLETPYLENNIHYTRMAYNLDEIESKSYQANDSLSYDEIQQNKEVIQNIRLWDQKLIDETYQQLQEIRLYYQFYNVDLDRYHTDEGYRQVLISARELEPTLPQQAQTWVNKHLQYTHGYGLVMSPTAEKTKQGSPVFYIKDIPPSSDINIKVTQPAIYYGENNEEYKLVNTEIKELNYPKGDKNVYIHYDGTGGVPINSFFRRLLFSWSFGDANLMLTDYIREGSKIQFWTNVKTRIENIAPFLQLSDDPYIVVNDDGKLYWMQDAYTIASQFPYASPYRYNYNYIRNSVKVVIDAYNGTVNFYVANEKDPVLKVYRSIFPEMFKPLSEMPGELKHHIKYPKHLFSVQMEMFSKYHMTTPQVFYNKEDLWERPTENYGGRQVKMEPYYVLSSLPGEHELQYLLISPMTPSNRDNMIAWVTVSSDYPNYGKMIVYELPKERLLLGPAQIEAKINQDTKISRLLSLWDQRGSQVMRGNLMVIPINKSFLYVEPVFLISHDVNIPQLKRVIASTGSEVVMEPTLDEAIAVLYGKENYTDIDKVAIDTAGVIQVPVEESVALDTGQIEHLRKLWNELKSALKAGDWERFGQKMEELNKAME